MNLRRPTGITFFEVLVSFAIIVVFITVLVSAVVAYSAKRGGITETLERMRTLHTFTQALATDRQETGHAEVGWPGDIGGSFRAWAAELVPAYLTTNYLATLLSAPGVTVPPGRLPRRDEAAIRVYAVTAQSLELTVLFSTANFTNTPAGGAPLSHDARPYGDKIFAVFQKGGDGRIFLAHEVGNAHLIGGCAPPVKE